MPRDDEYDYWTYEEYKPLTFIPTTAYEAVYCVEENGRHQLVSWPVDGIGIAECTRQERRRLKNSDRLQGEILSTTVTNEIVTYELMPDEGFSVSNEASNFAGIRRIGSLVPLEDCMSHLKCEYRHKLEGKKTP